MPDDRVHQAAELTSLRVRFPFRDHRVERAAHGLPLAYRYTEAEHKRLLRALLARYVPRNLWDLPKHGLGFSLLRALLRRDNYELVRRYIDPTRLARYRTR